MSDDAKSAILKRRARFIAAALTAAGVSAASCGGETDTSATNTSIDAGGDADGAPQPCLGALPPDASDDADAGPQPCLEPPLPDASDGASDAAINDAPDDAPPQPCLTPSP